MFQSQFLEKMGQSLVRPIQFQTEDFGEHRLEKGVHVGLDIGASSIKIIEVKTSAKGLVVKTVAYREFGRSWETKSSMPQETLITETLVELWRSHKIKAQDVRLIISDPAVYLRYLMIPKMQADELQKALRWQIEKYVPFPIEEASVDYQLVESEGMKDKADMGIIAVAVERKVINKYLDILKAIKVIPSTIDIAAFAVAKAVIKISGANSKETVLIVDIGAKTTSMVIIRGRTLLMVRNIETAGDQMTRVISDSAGVDRETAENLKRQAVLAVNADSGSIDDKMLRALQGICEDLSQEIERSLTYCEREGLAESIDKIILCGAGAKLNGLDKFIAGRLGLPVELIDVSKHVSHEITANAPLTTEFLAAYGGLF